MSLISYSYHCYQSEDIAPKDSLVLWPVPFFQARNGYAHEILGKDLELDDHVNFATSYQVLDEHLQAPSSISAKHDWFCYIFVFFVFHF
jgi:hypothetical protein